MILPQPADVFEAVRELHRFQLKPSGRRAA